MSDNIATFSGGGVMNFGTMTVSGGTLSGNTAVNSGGGIQNDFGTVYLDASSIIGSREGSPAIPI